MAINALSKRVADLSDLPVKNPDGSPMLDDAGNAVTATLFSPATKVWQAAHSARRRKAVKRVRENGGKLEAGLDGDVEDVIEFLCTVTKRFNGLEIPDAPDQVRAIYSEPSLGFIRDAMDADASNWENFTVPSATSSPSTPVSLAG